MAQLLKLVARRGVVLCVLVKNAVRTCKTYGTPPMKQYMDYVSNAEKARDADTILECMTFLRNISHHHAPSAKSLLSLRRSESI